MTSVKGALNRAHLIGFDVSTADGNMINVLSTAQMALGSANHINSIDFFVTGGPALVIPNFESIDLLTVDCVTNDTHAHVTTVGNFSKWDRVWLYEIGTYTLASQEVLQVVDITASILTFKTLAIADHHVADTGTAAVVGDYNGYIPVDTGMSYSQEGLDWKSLGIRKFSAADVRIRGTAVVV